MSDLNQRIETVYKRDVIIAWAFVIGLWFAVIFVAIATWKLAPEGPWHIILLIGGVAVLLFNTASIGALVKHYKEDKHFIYTLDLKYLDEMRNRKAGG